MKIEKAINTLSLFGCFDCKRYSEDLDCCYDNMDCWEAKDMAIEALKKQIPQKPIIGKYDSCKCVNHHNIPVINREHSMPYCPFCGQRMDWSED